MQLRKLLRVYNNFIVPTVMLGVCILMVLYVLVPAVKTIQIRYESQKELIREIAAIKKKVTILESLDEGSLRSHMVTLMTAIPANKSLQTVFTTLDAVALNSGFTILDTTIINAGNVSTNSASVQIPGQPNDQPFVSIKVGGNGSIDQVKRFLTSLVSVRRLFRVNTISVGTDASGISEALVEIDAFYVPLPKTLGAISDQLSEFTANEEEVLSKLSAYPLVSADLRHYDSMPEIQYGNKEDPFSLN